MTVLPPPGHRVLFGPNENPLMYQNKVIECALDPVDQKLWHFMRERKDKLTANAYHVYQSVSAPEVCC